MDIRIANARSAASRGGEGSAEVINVTSKGPQPWQRFSPFYPHGGIPVPFWPGRTAESVEGIWQGLKRFEHEDQIDERAFDNRTMKGLKRTSRAKGSNGVPRGRVLGHQRGDSDQLLEYLEARVTIYLPSYLWVLENRLQPEVQRIRELAETTPIVLLDYETNTDVANTARPLSHAALIRAYLLDQWPAAADFA